MEQNISENNQEPHMKLSRVKISDEIFKKIAKLILNTMKVDEYTAKVIDEKIIETGNFKYINILRKNSDFLTPIRLMVLVDYVDILDALKYYLHGLGNSEKINADKYNIITGLQAAELKLILLEHIYEQFESSKSSNIINAVFHSKEEKVDAIIDVKDQYKIKMYDFDGCDYMATLNEGSYGFESRACCSITDAKYIIENEKRKEQKNKYKKYFIFVPKDTTIFEKVNQELEQNNIKIIYSEYSTIDIVNDVVSMEGILGDDFCE